MRTADISTSARAQSLRKPMTDAERKLWFALRGRRFSGKKFVRQFPIGPYFADYCCRSDKLIVEADGSQHADSHHDQRRDAFLVAQGYRVLRFWNNDILNDIDSIRETIAAALENRLEVYDRYKGS